RHAARACPPCAYHHSDRREFIFGLNDREGGFSIFPDAIFLHVIDEGFDERGRWRDRVPRHHRYAGEHAAQGGGGISIDDDLAGSLVHALDKERVNLRERGRRI